MAAGSAARWVGRRAVRRRVAARLLGSPAWKTPGAPQDAEVRAAFDGFVAYCGTYEVNEKEQYVVHHVDLDKAPHIVGTDRRRSFVFSGNRLSLTLPSPPREGATQSTLVWERVTK